jgi:MFS family permease
MFAAIFWGSTLSILIAGFLADRYGPKSLFTVAAVVVGLGTALTPLAAHTNLWLAVIVRLFVGLGSVSISLSCLDKIENGPH